MNTKFSYALVGSFVLLFAGLLIAIALWLGFRGDKNAHVPYVVYFNESVSGLNPKAAVKYRGVSVGHVADIALDIDPTRVRVLLAVQPDTPIKEDTLATLSTQGITGIAFIELAGGSVDARALTSKSESTTDDGIPEIRSKPSLLMRLDTAVTQLLGQLSTVATNTSAVVSKMNVLLETTNFEATNGILENVRDMTASFSTQVAALSKEMGAISKLTTNAANVSEELPSLAAGMAQSIEALKGAATSVRNASRGFDKLTRSSQKGLDQVAGTTLPQVDRLLAQLQQLTGTMNQLAQQLERNPNMLLFGRGGRRGPGE